MCAGMLIYSEAPENAITLKDLNNMLFITSKGLFSLPANIRFLHFISTVRWSFSQVIQESVQSSHTFRFDCSKLLEMALVGQWEFMGCLSFLKMDQSGRK